MHKFKSETKIIKIKFSFFKKSILLISFIKSLTISKTYLKRSACSLKRKIKIPKKGDRSTSLNNYCFFDGDIVY